MHVVVLGAGYAGVVLTRLLERRLPPEVDITVVDESPSHLVQHELHRVIRRPSLAENITIPLTDVVERADVRVARVEGINRDERVIVCSDGTLTYDIAAICLGAETAFYGLEGVREHATPLKRLHHAREIREDVLEALEEAANAPTDSASDRARIVVGGAGLSGVQVAGELAAFVDEQNANRIENESGRENESEGTQATVTLLEQFDRVAPSFPQNFQEAVRGALESVGVEVRTETPVLGATDSHIRLEDGESLPYDVFVWTGGIAGPGALEGERPTVRSDLRLDKRTFALGDAARVADANGSAVPASAQSAVREARTVAENVTRLVEYESGDDLFEPRLEQFSFDSPGWLVSVGDDAVAQVGPAVVTGRGAKALKTTVGVGYLSAVGAMRQAVELVQEELER